MAYSYKGSLSFGLVYIPITLHNSVRDNNIEFKLLDKKTMSRIRYKKVCEECDSREVKASDIVKGFEYAEGQFVIFEDEDFEKIKSQKDKSISIEKFVNLDEVDPIYFNRPYYVNPLGAEKAFLVLLKAMEEENKAGLARTVLGNKETLTLIRAKDGEMLLNTLYFDEEIQVNKAKEVSAKFSKKELDLAKTLIHNLEGPFDIENYVDEYKERVKAAIDAKISGKKIVSKKEKKASSSSSLLEALQMSLTTKKTRAKVSKKKK